MKKILFFILFISLIHGAKAQERRKNVVYTEFGGAMVVGIGAGFERYIPVNTKIKFTARLGGGLVHNFEAFSPHFGGSLLYGKRSAIEVGVNQLFNIDLAALQSSEFVDSDKVYNTQQLLLGYRYKNENSGLVLRVFLVPPIGEFANLFSIPYGGLSIGYAF